MKEKLKAPTAGDEFLNGICRLGMSTHQKQLNCAANAKDKVREKWNIHLEKYNTMKCNYEQAIQTYNSQSVKKWSGKLMNAVLPMLKRPGDGPKPGSIKKGLDVYFENRKGRSPLSFQEYIHVNKVNVPNGADIFNPLPFDISTDTLVTEENNDNSWDDALPNGDLCKTEKDALTALLALGVDDEKGQAVAL